MSEELEALARRAVACPGWRWMRGMRANVDVAFWHEFSEELTIHHADDDGIWWVARNGFTGGPGARYQNLPPCLPDLADPATIGCLLELVRDAWEDDCMHAEPESTAWRVWRRIYPMGMAGEGPTEVAALVAALEAAPALEVQP